MTLKPEAIAELRARLRRGGSIRQIAREFAGKISRGTITAVAQNRSIHTATIDPDALDTDPPRPCRRCPDCGRLVTLPCIACRALAYRDLTRRLQRRTDHSEKTPSLPSPDLLFSHGDRRAPSTQ